MTLRDNFLYFILLELGLLGYLINDIILKKRALWMRSTDAVIPYMWAVNVMYQRSHGARPAWGAGPGRVAVAVLCLRRGSHARAHRQQGSHDRAHLAAGSHDVIPLIVGCGLSSAWGASRVRVDQGGSPACGLTCYLGPVGDYSRYHVISAPSHLRPSLSTRPPPAAHTHRPWKSRQWSLTVTVYNSSSASNTYLQITVT